MNIQSCFGLVFGVTSPMIRFRILKKYGSQTVTYLFMRTEARSLVSGSFRVDLILQDGPVSDNFGSLQSDRCTINLYLN